MYKKTSGLLGFLGYCTARTKKLDFKNSNFTSVSAEQAKMFFVYFR
jgi:hypothetical protein